MDPFEMAEIGKTGLRVTRLGLGGGPLGYREDLGKVPEEVAVASIHHALALGIRYVDTAPFYGRGRSEMVFAQALTDVPRDSYAISTKVGRMLPLNGSTDVDFSRYTLTDLPELDVVYDYSRDGVLRSVEQSLTRLQLDRVDMLIMHDIDPEHYRSAIGEGFPALAELRAKGHIKAIGAGLADLDVLDGLAGEGDFDFFMLAWRYTLLDKSALEKFLPLCVEKGISIIIAGPYDGGRMLGLRPPRRPEDKELIPRLNGICDRHGVPIQAAALQFVSAHPAVVSVIPGPTSPEEARDNVRMMEYKIPQALWGELHEEGLIPLEAPTPAEPL